MTGVNKQSNTNFYSKKDKTKHLGGNDKAATLADSPLIHKFGVKGERWADALQTYSDYFIRY